MLLPRRVEEVVIAVPNSVYDAAVARLAEAGLLHVDDPPRELGGRPDRELQNAYRAAAEKASRLEGYFELAGLKARTVKGVEVRVSSWLEALPALEEEYRDLEREFESASAEITDLEAKVRELQAVRALLEDIKHIDADLRRAALESRYVSFAVGLSNPVPPEALEEIASKHGVVVAYEEVAGGEQAVVAVAGPAAGVHAATRALRAHGWSPLRLPEGVPGNPRRAYEEVSNAISRFISRIETIREYLRGLADRLAEYYTKVVVLREALRILAHTVRTRSVSVVRGFVDVRDRRRLERVLGDATGGAYTVVSLGVRVAEERVPSKVEVPRFLKPFQRVLELYGHPEPNEIVPVVFMAITMPVIFGLMFPDLGHGLLVLAFALLYLRKRSPDWAFLGAVLGVAGMVTGFLAGEFFGPLTGKPLVKLWESLGFENPPLASPLHAVESGDAEAMQALFWRSTAIALWVGAFMLTLGTLLGFIDALIKREYDEAFAVKLPKFILFASATLPFLITLDINKSGAILGEAAMGPRETLLAKIVFYGVVAGFVWLALGEPIAGLLRGHGVHIGKAFMETFESFLMLLGNIPSFLRIMGLSLAHSSLMAGFAFLSEPFLHHGPAGWVGAAIVYTIGNLLTAGLEALVAFAHDLRLHFYEWFSKFYSGRGVPFQPVRVPEGVKLVLLTAPGKA